MGMDFSFLQAISNLPVQSPGNIRGQSAMRQFSGNIGAPKDGLV